MTMCFPDPRPAIVEVKVISVHPDGPAFGRRTDNGEQVYISAATRRKFNLDAGTMIESEIQENTVAPQRTPWFASRVHSTEDGTLISELVEIAKGIMSHGGVWTPETLGPSLGLAAEDAEAVLEVLYRAEECAKFVLFERAGRSASKVWFTMTPERVDVDEFEDEGVSA